MQFSSKIPRIPKAHFILREEIANSDGEYPIYITYSIDQKTAKASTGIFVPKTEWDFKRSKVKRSHARHMQLNSVLQLKRHEIDSRILDALSQSELSINLLRSILKGEEVNSKEEGFRDFIDFAEDVMEKEYKREKIGISVLSNAKCGLNIFRKYLELIEKRDSLLVKDINAGLIDNYIIWRKEYRENSNETINKSLTPIFKAVRVANSLDILSSRITEAICERYLPPTKPHLEEDCKDEEIRYLTYNQLDQFTKLYNKVKYDRTRDYMDMFLFSFHACGLRFVDVLTLQWANIDFERKIIKKVLVKNRSAHTIPLTNGAKAILERWKGRVGCSRFCFGLLPNDFNLNDDTALNRQRLNKNRPIKTSLNEIGRKMELPFSLTFHCARHTFAVLNLNRESNPLSIETVSRLLGHTSILVTERVYARFLPKRLEQDLGLDSFSEILPN